MRAVSCAEQAWSARFFLYSTILEFVNLWVEQACNVLPGICRASIEYATLCVHGKLRLCDSSYAVQASKM